MTRYIAFIRGVNGGLTLKMADLRQLIEKLGFGEVQTILATGNVIFETSDSKERIIRRIEQAFDQEYHYKTVVILFTALELQKLIRGRTFQG